MSWGWKGLGVMAAVAVATPAHATTFAGAYAPDQWVSSGIVGGDAEVDLGLSSSSELVCGYDVDLGSGGVSERFATFSAVSQSDGYVSLSWSYDLMHAWYNARASLIFYAYDSSGTRQDTVVVDDSTSGGTSFSGTLVDMQVWANQEFGLEVGGSNFDSNAVLRGTVTLSDFEPPSDLDCAGVLFGPARLDACGTCDDDPTNDCVQDCAGVFGGVAVVDECGTCDDDASNDCVQDCLGDWGGLAVEDQCGTCDDDATNDCVQDCLGDWGGSAVVDECGTCDDDASNDCVQDCAGVWGGSATLDLCGDCDDDPTNDCETDCLGVPGGLAQMDECGVCDHDRTNNCEQDCDGVWGGTATVDACGVCVGGETGVESEPCEAAPEEGASCGCASTAPASGVMWWLVGLTGWMVRRRGRVAA